MEETAHAENHGPFLARMNQVLVLAIEWQTTREECWKIPRFMIPKISIAGREIGLDYPHCVIAELSANHYGKQKPR